MSPRIILRGLFASTCQWAVMWLKRVEASRSSAPNIARDHASPPSVTVSVWGTERVAITRLRETLAQLSCRLSFSAVRGVGESEGRPGRKFEYWVVALHILEGLGGWLIRLRNFFSAGEQLGKVAGIRSRIVPMLCTYCRV